MNNIRYKISRLAVSTALVSLGALSGAAMAQDSAAPTRTTQAGSGDIIVTAQRREQTALDTPLSLTALDETLMENKQVNSLNDLQFVSPGIRTGQTNGVNRIFIRGIGLQSFASGADSSVAYYVDGVVIGRPSQQLSSFFDVERVEVLRGPQGALYGRNATGGAINVITRSAERELGGYARLTAGNYGLLEAEGALNAPLTEGGDLSARLAFKFLNRDGYGYDFGSNHDVNDASSQSVRATLQYNPDNGTDIRLIAEYTHENDYNNYVTNFGPYLFDDISLCPFNDGTSCALPGVVNFGGFEIRNSQDAATNLDLFPGKTNRREGYAITLNANFELNDQLSLNSITGWRRFDRYNSSNADGSSTGIGNVDYDELSEQFSQEVILNYDTGPLLVTAGASYYHEKIENHVIAPFIQFDDPTTPGLDNPYKQDGFLKIDAFAAYLQATYSIMPELRITAAGRYSTEKRSSTGAFTGLFVPVVVLDDSERWSSFTPKVGIEYDLTPDLLAYASFTKGFKSGTFNTGQANPAIDPEKIDAYEVGLKGSVLSNLLSFTAAYFHYDYTDLQVNKIIGIGTQTTNAAAATTDGFEMSVTANVSQGLTLNGNFTYLDSTFSDFDSINPLFPADPAEDLKGNMLPGAPKYAFVAGAQYVVPVGSSDAELLFNADVSYQSKVFYSEFNDPQIGRGSTTKVNGLIKYDSGRNWSLSAWGKNIFNEKSSNNIALGIALWGLPLYGAIDPPATFGGTLDIEF